MQLVPLVDQAGHVGCVGTAVYLESLVFDGVDDTHSGGAITYLGVNAEVCR